jgi:hypothetical protein
MWIISAKEKFAYSGKNDGGGFRSQQLKRAQAGSPSLRQVGQSFNKYFTLSASISKPPAQRYLHLAR